MIAIRAFLAVICLAAALPGQQGLPPLIDRELLFGNPEIAGVQLSPDGQYMAFLKPYKDTRNIWIKKANEPFAAARLLTAETKRPIPAFFFTRDSKRVLFVKDNDGDENFNVYAVDPAAAQPGQTGAPPAKDLTGLKGVRIYIYDLPKTNPAIAHVGLNDRDKAWHDLYELNLVTGERKLLRKNTERVAAWIFDLKGQLRLAERVDDSGEQEVLRVDGEALKKIYSCGIFDTCNPNRFHKDGKRVYLTTNKGEAQDLTALALLDVDTGQTEIVESDPLKRVDLQGAAFSEVTDELTATIYVDEKRRIVFKSKELAADYKWLEKQKPGREVSAVSKTLDESKWIVAFNGDTEPGEVYLFDRKARKLVPQYKVRDKIDRAALSPMSVVRYPSSDGLEIPAYLTLPKGLPPKNLPVIVLPHGGPWGRDVWGYNTLHQFAANRGYAVLSPNFRGSTGFGRKFLNAGNGEWGRKMQDDITWGVKYLVSKGIADPKRIGIMGGSYGGYATLAGVAFTPELYKAGVDIVGPSNLATLLEAIPPYWEAGRKMMYARMADLGTEEGRKWLAERSPLNSASKIKTPLMVVQGANDPRVAKREAEQIVIALRDRGFPVEYLLADDEGHGFQRPVNNMAMFMAVEKFLAGQLDGRYQEGGKPEVVARLAELRVDPKTVTLAKAGGSGAPGPKPDRALPAGDFKYSVVIAMGPQQMKMDVTTSIKESAGQWVVVDKMQSPMGEGVDTTTLDGKSLEMVKRNVKQGPVTVDLTFAGKKATGSVTMNGQEKPVNSDLAGPPFGDGAGAQFSLAALPLAEGYATSYHKFDIQKLKETAVDLKVSGTESVTVPAGTFNSFKLEVTPSDGSAGKSIIWIDQSTRKPVKITSTMPQMGGATLTMELQ
jgi:dipeptidyl aminopeptidase/acylaminoacyl peptidase